LSPTSLNELDLLRGSGVQHGQLGGDHQDILSLGDAQVEVAASGLGRDELEVLRLTLEASLRAGNRVGAYRHIVKGVEAILI